MPLVRRVTDPAGVDWYVDVDWTGRRAGGRVERRLARRREHRAEQSRTAPGRRRARWWDRLDFPYIFGDEFGLWLLVVVVAVVVAVLLGPWALVLAIDLIEILLFPLFAAVIVGWRVARKHAFTVVAARWDMPLAVWKVTGWREARRVERAIAEAIEVGGDPGLLFEARRMPDA